jgi:hypothetical protein
LEKLIKYLCRVPVIAPSIGSGEFDDGGWWVKFSLDCADAENITQHYG